jgi:heterotetrameric sarcosine oxidase delta subunit
MSTARQPWPTDPPMLLIPCPFCGPRDESEFRYGAAGGIELPADTPALDDQAWAEFVFVRPNPKGPLDERWMHAHGCRRWFSLRRDTATDEILSDPVPSGWPRPPRGTAIEPGPRLAPPPGSQP